MNLTMSVLKVNGVVFAQNFGGISDTALPF